jgi:sugar phosphate isomerase/epimerase
LAPWFQKQNVPQVLTLHIGSNSIPVEELDWEVGLTNLKHLGEFAAQRNGSVLLENLKVGWTTDPKTHLQMVDHAGLDITFDTGHAASNPRVRSGELNLLEYADTLGPKIRHVHFYAYESLDQGRHMPPETWQDIAATWSKVVKLPVVESVVLELATRDELVRTFGLLMENSHKWSGR